MNNKQYNDYLKSQCKTFNSNHLIYKCENCCSEFYLDYDEAQDLKYIYCSLKCKEEHKQLELF